MAVDGEAATETVSEEPAAPETATEDTTETTEATTAESSAPAEAKFKVRRGGREAEFTAAEMAKMLDDEYEHDFHGALGKPLLIDGKPVKHNWKGIQRAVQDATGAAEARRRFSEESKRFAQMREWAKAPENRATFMQRELGIEDFDQWVLERAGEAFERRTKMVELAAKDPVAYEREYKANLDAQSKAQREALERLEKQQNSEREHGERVRQWTGRLGEELKKIGGVPLNSRTYEIAVQIRDAWDEAQQQLPWDKLAEFVRDAWHEEIFGYIDPQPDEALLQLLGDKRRERLRAAEIAALKGKKAAAKAAETGSAPKPKPNGATKPRDGMTAAEFLRSGRNGGRV